MKNRRIPLRRGSCGFQILLALAVIALLVAVFGLVSTFTSGLGDTIATAEKIVKNSTPLEAPGTTTATLVKGGAVVAFHPDGKVGDKAIGRPPASVNYAITVIGPDGELVRFEPNTAPRDPRSPFEVIGFFKTAEDGDYTVTATPSDGSTPAAIMVASADLATLQSMLGSAAWAFGGGCLAVCGLVMAIAFGIPAILMRRSARRRALEAQQA